jgi:hypothetical protein
MGKSDVQCVLFSTKKWTRTRATAWLKKHGFRTDTWEEKPEHFRFQQVAPETERRRGKNRFRTIRIGDGSIEFIIAA